MVNFLLLIEAWLDRYTDEFGSVEDVLNWLKYINIDFIQEDLGCNTRTAYDYKHAIQELVKIIQDRFSIF